MRSLLVMLLVSSLCQGYTCPPKNPFKRHTPRVRETTKTAIPSVVFLDMDCGGCTGFVVKPGVVITAAHCVDDLDEHLTIVFVDGYRSPATRLRVGNRFADQSQDIAILKADTHGVTPLELETGIYAPTKCASIGYGMEHTQKASMCYGGIRTAHNLGIYMGKIDYGDSGGPVVNNKGKVIGENNSIYDDYPLENPPVFWAVPVENIHKMLKLEGLE
jgi:S1-C subfamily serine protease